MGGLIVLKNSLSAHRTPVVFKKAFLFHGNTKLTQYEKIDILAGLIRFLSF